MRPPKSSKPPKVNEYAVISHSRLAFEKCRSLWMVGRATLTMVESSTIMSWAAEITTRARPKCLPAVLVPAGSGWFMVDPRLARR